jgi:hypothetical protein
MRNRSWLLTLLAAILVQGAMARDGGPYQYVYPVQNSQYVPRTTPIIVRPGERLDRTSITDRQLINVEGTRSGVHEGRVVISDDGKTLIFTASRGFDAGETVVVGVREGIRLENGDPVKPYQFQFVIVAREPSAGMDPYASEAPDHENIVFLPPRLARPSSPDSLPADFPPIRIDSVSNPAPGELFLANFGAAGSGTPYANYLLVLNDSARALAYKRIGMVVNPFAYMFTQDPTGRLSYIERNPTTTKVFVVDTAFVVKDTYPPGNPQTASHADFFLLPNGHALALYFDYQIVDMSKIVKGGHPAANVMGTTIQEYDASKNVVFYWRSFDYIAITDTYEDTLAATIDYTHGNGIDLDNDGNILLSNRHTCEIIKIDRNTGEILWRLGGKHNQFTFINEHAENAPLYFSYQHDIKRLPNGHVTLFDNGNRRAQKYSRAVEYVLDEQAKTATLYWEYRHTPDVYASAQGSVQRLQNGNTLIGWGDASLSGNVAATEIHPDRSIAMELHLPLGHRTMRIYRLPWSAPSLIASRTLHDMLPGNTYAFTGPASDQQTGVKITFNGLSPVFYNSATVQRYRYAPLSPQFEGRAPWSLPARITIAQTGMASFDTDITFDVGALALVGDPDLVSVFGRDTVGRGVFRKLATTYNSVANVLVAKATAFGEFLFGWDDTSFAAKAPLLYGPLNRDSVNQQLPVAFRWTPQGYADGYQLQLSTDSLFGTILRNDSLLTTLSDTLKSVTPRTRHFWRVRSRNGQYTSGWSSVWSFIATEPYISVLSPADTAVWERGKPYFIIWRSNITAKVRIDLFRIGVPSVRIADSVNNIGSYAWTIPSAQTADTTYAIRVRSVSDTTVLAFSTSTFTIRPAVVAVDEPTARVGAFSLSQNYPNPFNPSTEIGFEMPDARDVTLTIFDLLGRKVAVLVNDRRGPGRYVVTFDGGGLSSGVYVYRFKAGSYVATKSMILTK